MASGMTSSGGFSTRTPRSKQANQTTYTKPVRSSPSGSVRCWPVQYSTALHISREPGLASQI